ncbi:MAG: DUF481 domain-containing protein, partial [Planctomycetota bacterium]
ELVIELDSGTRLRGVVVNETEERLVFDADGLGEVTIDPATVAKRLPDSAPIRPKPSKADFGPPPGLFGTGILRGFNKSVSLGISGREADTSDLNVNASAEADFNGDDRRWVFRSAYFFGTSDGERSQDEAFANLRRDWKLPGRPPFLFAEGRGQYDDFQDWQARLGGFAGVGYAFAGPDSAQSGGWPTIENDQLTLLGRVGAGGSYEFGTVNEFAPEALIAGEVEYKFDDGKSFRIVNTIFPDLDDTGEFRNTTEASLKVVIDHGLGLNLKVGAFNEYLSETEGDTSHNSLSYFLNLVYDF